MRARQVQGWIAGVVLFAAGAVPATAQVTTRIETRPYYGAIVSVESGVRVWRALPAHDRIIINPEGRTPVSLNIVQAPPQAPTIVHNEANASATAPGRSLGIAVPPYRPFGGYWHPLPSTQPQGAFSGRRAH
jgi:hypothetical protein